MRGRAPVLRRALQGCLLDEAHSIVEFANVDFPEVIAKFLLLPHLACAPCIGQSTLGTTHQVLGKDGHTLLVDNRIVNLRRSRTNFHDSFQFTLSDFLHDTIIPDQVEPCTSSWATFRRQPGEGVCLCRCIHVEPGARPRYPGTTRDSNTECSAGQRFAELKTIPNHLRRAPPRCHPRPVDTRQDAIQRRCPCQVRG